MVVPTYAHGVRGEEVPAGTCGANGYSLSLYQRTLCMQLALVAMDTGLVLTRGAGINPEGCA